MTTRHRLGAALGATTLALLAACSGPGSTPSPDTRTAPSDGGGASTPAADGSTAPSGTAAPIGTAAPSGTPRATELAAGLTSPWGLVPLADGGVLVSERDTTLIREVTGTDSRIVAQVTDAVPGGEGGLLGIALDEQAARLFVYFTGADDNRVVSMAWDGTDLGTPEPILTGIPKGGRHNGGRIVLGPDGNLWIGTGDAGDEGTAQDTGSLGGKILRIEPSGEIPEDNPFENAVWSYGHRNVQGLAFDPDGRLWASEFGNNRFDELNLIERGANYGWPSVEGSGGEDGLTDPKLVWPTDDASPSGLAWWRDRLWMASLRGERLWEIPVEGTEVGEPVARFSGDYGRLRSVVVAADDESLLLSASDTDGRGDATGTGDELLRVDLR